MSRRRRVALDPELDTRAAAAVDAAVREADQAAASMTVEDLAQGAVEADQALVWLARQNVNVFCEYVLRDERTGRAHGQQSEHHLDWHRLANKERRLILWAFPEAGKTQQLTVGRTLWLLGRDPTLRLVVVSETTTLARKIVGTIRRYIEQSDELRRVFPDLRPGREAPWTETYLYVDRPTPAKEPSVQAFGLHGRIQGSRVDGMVLDDVLSADNTRTKTRRDDAYRWFGEVQGRLTDGAFVLAVGNAFHPDDLLHRLARQTGWTERRFPVVRADGTSAWPARWPLSRVDEKRRDVANASEFARQFLCQARADEDSFFKQEWIDVALRRGEGRQLAHAVVPGSGFRTVTGVDLAVQQHDAADLTCFFTVAIHPDESREVLDVTAGRWSGPEITRRCVEMHRRYNSVLVVENNACLPLGTNVLTRERGYVPIEDVVAGDHVWTHMARWRPVTGVVDGVSQKLTRARPRGALPVYATPNHWFWFKLAGRTRGRGGGHHRPVGDGRWASVGFASNDPLWLATAVPHWPYAEPVLPLAANPRQRALTHDVDEQTAVLLGLFMAKGHATRGQVFWTVSRREKHLVAFIVAAARRLAPDRAVTVRHAGSVSRVVVSSTQLARALRFGTGVVKTPPLAWMGWPLKLRVALVRGWLMGDGCLRANNGVKDTFFSGATVSRAWLAWARTTLLQAGYRVSVSVSKRGTYAIEGRTGPCAPVYTLRLNGNDSARLQAEMTSAVEAAHWRPVNKVRRHASGGVVLADGHAWVPLSKGPGTWEEYGGPVRNLEVAEDHSFTAEDVIVHNAQDFIVQAVRAESAVPVRGFTTGRNKVHPEHGVAAMGVEFENGKWIIPNAAGVMHPEVASWVNEMLYYDPRGHTGDRLMASWFAREGARMDAAVAEVGRVSW